MHAPHPALLAAGLGHLADAYWPLLPIFLLVLLASQAKSIAELPVGRHLAEFLGPRGLVWAWSGLCALGILGCVAVVVLRFFLAQGEPFVQLLYERGIHDARLTQALAGAMTPQVRALHNAHAERMRAGQGPATLEGLCAGIWDEITRGEESGAIPAGSVALYLDRLHARLLEGHQARGGLWSGWERDLAAWRGEDPHDYGAGPNPRIRVEATPAPDAGPSVWEQSRPFVVAVLVANAALAQPRENVNVAQEGVVVPWGAEFSYFYAYHNAGVVKPITRAEFAQLGVSQEQLHAQAVENLRQRIASGEGAQRGTLPNGSRTVSFGAAAGGYAAAFVLVPDLHVAMAPYVTPPFVAILPTEDSLSAAEITSTDPGTGAVRLNVEFLAGLEQVIADARAANTVKALSTLPVLVTEMGMVIYRHHPDRLPSGVEAYP